MQGSVVIPADIGPDRAGAGYAVRGGAGYAASVTDAVLLDTCAAIWLANKDRMAPEAVRAIVAAGQSGGIFVSPVSAWEIGMLSRPGAGRAGVLAFSPDPLTWFQRLMAGPGIRARPVFPRHRHCGIVLAGGCTSRSRRSAADSDGPRFGRAACYARQPDFGVCGWGVFAGDFVLMCASSK